MKWITFEISAGENRGLRLRCERLLRQRTIETGAHRTGQSCGRVPHPHGWRYPADRQLRLGWLRTQGQRGESPLETLPGQVDTYAAPVDTYAAPVDTYAAPVDTYAAPVNTYAALAVESYDAPYYAEHADRYSAPADNSDEHADSYSAPADNYAEHSDSYSAPADNYDEHAGSYSAPDYETYSAPADTYSASHLWTKHCTVF